jgi:hypothetical protein
MNWPPPCRRHDAARIPLSNSRLKFENWPLQFVESNTCAAIGRFPSNCNICSCDLQCPLHVDTRRSLASLAGHGKAVCASSPERAVASCLHAKVKTSAWSCGVIDFNRL